MQLLQSAHLVAAQLLLKLLLSSFRVQDLRFKLSSCRLLKRLLTSTFAEESKDFSEACALGAAGLGPSYIPLYKA